MRIEFYGPEFKQARVYKGVFRKVMAIVELRPTYGESRWKYDTGKALTQLESDHLDMERIYLLEELEQAKAWQPVIPLPQAKVVR